jgi:hypothetical protein
MGPFYHVVALGAGLWLLASRVYKRVVVCAKSEYDADEGRAAGQMRLAAHRTRQRQVFPRVRVARRVLRLQL